MSFHERQRLTIKDGIGPDKVDKSLKEVTWCNWDKTHGSIKIPYTKDDERLVPIICAPCREFVLEEWRKQKKLTTELIPLLPQPEPV